MSRVTGVTLARTVGAVGLVLGTLAAASGPALATASRSQGGFRCTVVGNAHANRLVGHSGDVVCGMGGNDVLIAKGPGRIVLIGGAGNDVLVASKTGRGHDILLGGPGKDRLAGGSGWSSLQGGIGSDRLTAGSGAKQQLDGGPGADSVSCAGSQGSVTVVGDDKSEGDQRSSDCKGDSVDSASQEWAGTVTATDGTTTMTITWTAANDEAQTWLAANGSPKSVTFDISSASIERDGGGPVQVGDGVEVAANPPSSRTTLAAIDVQAGSGGDDNQGDDDNQGSQGGDS